MLLVREIIGDAGEARFARRQIERLPVSSHDAPKRRLRGRTDAGTDIAVDLERGTYLRDGAVLADDGERLVVVARTQEEAMIVRLPPGLTAAELLAHGVRVGHAFGNQHVPVEVEDGEIRVPITTSREIAARTVRSLGIDAEVSFGLVQLGRDRPLAAPAHAH